MNFLNKLERKFGRYAIPHLTTYIIITYVIGYLLNYAFPSALGYMTLDPYMIIFHGQVWRLVSWLLIPPSSLDIFTVIMLFFYYSIGSSLERAWGDFRGSEGTNRNRFRADMYGKRTVDELNAEQKASSADTLIAYLSGSSSVYSVPRPCTEPSGIQHSHHPSHILH